MEKIEKIFNRKICLIIVLIITILIRLPFLLNDIGFNNDAPTYSANIEKKFFSGTYNVQMPGYISYIYLGRLIYFFTHNTVYSQHIINIILLFFISFFLFKLLELYQLKPVEILIFSIIFSFNNALFLGSITGGNRLFLTLSAIILIYLAIRIIINNENYYIIVFSILYAFFCGFRQDISINLFFLFVYIFYKIKDLKYIILSIILFILVSLTWLIPLIIEYGGILKYINNMTSSEAVYDTSIVFTGFNLAPLINVFRIFVYILNSFFFIFPFLIYSLIKKEYCLSKDNFIILLLCFSPAFLFQLLVHNGNFVHLTSFMAPMFIFFIMGFRLYSIKRVIFSMVIIVLLLFQFFGLKMLDIELPEKIEAKKFESNILLKTNIEEHKKLLLKYYIKDNTNTYYKLNNNIIKDLKLNKLKRIFYTAGYKYYERIINVLWLQYTYDGAKSGQTMRLNLERK